MALINIQLSQFTLDQIHTDLTVYQPRNGELGAFVDGIMAPTAITNERYANFQTWNLSGSTLQLNHSDGAVELYTGVVLAVPGAAAGTFSATGSSFSKAGLFSVATTGLIHSSYVTKPLPNGDTDLSLGDSALGITLKTVRLAMDLPSSSGDYDVVYGNSTLDVAGNITVDTSTGSISGPLTHFALTSQKVLASEVIDGNFQLAATGSPVGIMAPANVTGQLTSYKADYQDGGKVYVTGTTQVSASQQLGLDLLKNADLFNGDDTISVDLPGHLYSTTTIASGAGNDSISVKGGGGQLAVSAGAGNDTVTVLGDTHTIDGGAGLDTVKLASLKADLTIRAGAGSAFTVTDKAGAVQSLANVERLVLGDAAVALDISGAGGQAYRIYQAAFNRAPDAGGLGFYISVLDKGVSLHDMAQSFVDSAEFKSMYGTNPGNHDIVQKFYENVLHRAPDQGGLDFYVDVLDRHATDVASVLASMSESPENQGALAAIIGNGFTYTPYPG